MSADKHRNTNDRRLVLRVMDPQDELYMRQDRVRGHFDWRNRRRVPHAKGERRGNGRRVHQWGAWQDRMGRSSWTLYREIFWWLLRHGFIRKRPLGVRNDRHPQTGLKKRGRTHNGRIEIGRPFPSRPKRRRDAARQTRPHSGSFNRR